MNSNNLTTSSTASSVLNSTYYVLGYYPKDARRDGRFHKIEVRVKRPGLRVSARKGYVSPRTVGAEERARARARTATVAADAPARRRLRMNCGKS